MSLTERDPREAWPEIAAAIDAGEDDGYPVDAAWAALESVHQQLQGAVSETERMRHEVQARDDVIYHAAEHLRRALDAIAAYEDRITDVEGQ